jgi:hypothetical protein
MRFATLLAAIVAVAFYNAATEDDRPESARPIAVTPIGAVTGDPNNGEPLPSVPDAPKAPKDSSDPKRNAPKDGGDEPTAGAVCDPSSVPVAYRNLPGDTLGEAYASTDGDCRITIDPQAKADGPERHCTVLVHEREHIRQFNETGEMSHTDSGLMAPTLPDGFVAPECRSATAKAEEDSVFFRPRVDGNGDGPTVPAPSVD